jgi:channel protein (hemolysin III family)
MNEIAVYAIPGFREPFSCLTHLGAIPVFVVLGCLLIRKGRRSIGSAVSLTIMTLSTIFLLSMSGVYHLLAPGPVRDVMRLLDVCGVFVLIAGTITPVHTILFRGAARWWPLLAVWTLATTGIVFKSVFADRFPPSFELGSFLAMGWGGLVSFIFLCRKHGFPFVAPLMWGGLAYTTGAILLAAQGPTLIPGVITAHELWHVAVLAGLGFHWQFVFQFADWESPAGQATCQ